MGGEGRATCRLQQLNRLCSDDADADPESAGGGGGGGVSPFLRVGSSVARRLSRAGSGAAGGLSRVGSGSVGSGGGGSDGGGSGALNRSGSGSAAGRLSLALSRAAEATGATRAPGAGAWAGAGAERAVWEGLLVCDCVADWTAAGLRLVCVCVCVCARARACVHSCVRVCEASPVVLAFILAWTLLMYGKLMIQTHQYVSFAVRNAAHSQVPSSSPPSGPQRHICMSPACLVASLGIQELAQQVALETRLTDKVVGGSGTAGTAPDLRHQPPGPTRMCKRSRSRDIL